MPARPRRIWYRFSLRTLFVLVTIVGVWLGYQMSIVRERQALRASIVAHGGQVIDTDPSAARMPDIEDVPWYRRQLGDRAVATICMKREGSGVTPPADLRRVLQVFPESEVWAEHFADNPIFRMRDLTGKLQMVKPLPDDLD